MTQEQREEIVRQFHNKVHGIIHEVQDAQQLFFALAPECWSAYDKFVMMNDAFEILKRDASVAIDRVWKVRDQLQKEE